jgi:hypothetical protein
MKLEQPNRIVAIKAKHLADAIDAIADYIKELSEASHECTLAEDRESIKKQIKRLALLWDRISDTIEK